jgi:tRNA (guanine-N7-)-methyltransferase
MGRRALRKLKTPLDLSRQLKRFEDLPLPWDPQPLFGRQAPLAVEVGSGKGLFLRSAAAAQPATDFLGIELAGAYAEHAAARLIAAGLNNAVVVAADALRVFAERLPDGSLTAVHVYFPDPWWKQRHRKRRVMRESFLRDIQRTLQPGGSLHFWTDVEEYYRSTLALLAATTQLEGPLPVPQSDPRHDMDYRTHFERRTRLEGSPVYRAEFRKSL